MRKRSLLLTAVLLAGISGLAAQNSTVDYVEGWVDLKNARGETFELFIGDRVVKGDTVITGRDGLAELVPQAGSRIIIQPGTVFSVQERQVGGQTRTAVSVTLGEIAFKFDKMTGAEPDILTPSAACGIRGTEFTVYAGADGSSMIIVDSGAVEVESQGAAVMLAPEEGVEVRSGQVPGEKFQVLRGRMDFSAWNQGREEDMLSDPLAALDRMGLQLRELAENLEVNKALYEKQLIQNEQNKEAMRAMAAQGKNEEASAFLKDTVRPGDFIAHGYLLNYRYYALAAESFRRHVMTGLYVRMKTRFLADHENSLYRQYLLRYGELLNEYEARIVPVLIDADI